MTRSSMQHQRGATLLISLIMLVVLTLFAVAGFNLSSVNLKIAGNYQAQKSMEAVAQQAIEQIISSAAAFDNPGAVAATLTVSGYTVNVGTPVCNYAVEATGYTKKIGELIPEDTDWQIRADVTDPLSKAKAVIVQGIRIRMLAGKCP